MTRKPYQRSQAWLDERRTGIGASEAPVLVEGNEEEWRELFARKLGLIPERESNEAMEIGSDMEPVIAKRYALRTGQPVVKVDRIVRYPEHPEIFASLDRRTRRGRRAVELKAVGHPTDDFGPDGSDQLPDRMIYQVQQQLLCIGYDVADVAVLFGGRELRVYPVGRDQSLIEEIIALEVAAWAFIARGEMPPWPGPAARAPTLRADEVEATPELLALIDEHEALTARSTQAEKHLDEIKDRIRAYLADVGGARGVLPDGRVVTVSHRPNKPTEKPAWKQIADGYRRRLLDLGIPPEELDFAQTALTTVSAGARPLLVKIKETRRHAA